MVMRTYPLVDAHAMALTVDPHVLRAFNLVTLGPQIIPWGLMVVAPRWRVTRAIVEPWIIPLLCALAHASVDAVGFAAPGALEEAATFARVFDPTIPVTKWADDATYGPFEAFNEMLRNPNFVGEEWTHVLTWDLFVGRFVYLDALARGVPNLRLALLMINFTGPPGLLAYAASCFISGKGLPPIPGSERARVVIVERDAAASATRERNAGARLREAFIDGGGRAAAVIAACAEGVIWDDLSSGRGTIVGRDALYAELAERDAEDASCGAAMKIERVAEGTKMAGATFSRTNAAGERGLRGTLAVEIDEQGMISRITRATEPLLKPGGATAKLLKAVAKQPEATESARRSTGAAASSRASDIVRFLWFDVQGCEDFKDIACDYFARDVVYEDVNFELPFVGSAQVREFLDEFDIPGLKFNPISISDGDDACVFTWEVDLGTESATRVRGLSFYERNSEGKISYIRDIPGSAGSPVFAKIAASMNPALRTFASTPSEAELVRRAAGR